MIVNTISMNRFFVHGWNHDQDNDLLHQLSSFIKIIKENSESAACEIELNDQHDNAVGESVLENKQVNQMNQIIKDERCTEAFSLYFST